MKWLIRRDSQILAFAYPRKQAIARIENIAPTMLAHFLKIMIYQDRTGDLNHWIDEISNFVRIISDLELKPHNTKLSKSAYAELLQNEFGDTPNDADVNLSIFQATQTGPDKYPRFKVTPELIQTTFQRGQQFIDKASEIGSSKEKLTAEDIKQIISPILHLPNT